MKAYTIIEQYPTYSQPVGSVLDTQAGRVLYRNIDERHIFTKGSYKALFVDDAVIDWLGTNDKIDEVVFDCRGKGVYKIGFEQYRQAKAKKMSGRRQKGISLDRFIFEPTNLNYQRPEEKQIISLVANGSNN
jgi:hypothetical protein